MGFGDLSYRARTNPRSPRAFGVCDDCGGTFNHADLVRQQEWFGNAIKWTGFLVCRQCDDVPQEQLRPIILPPDPVPIPQPRPEYYVLDNGLQGFTSYVLDPGTNPPTDKPTVLAQIAALSGVPTPGGLADISTTVSGTTQVAGAQTRSYLLLYNPGDPQIFITCGGAPIVIGPGQSLFWATAQANIPPYAGIITATAIPQPAGLYAWQA